MTREEVLKVVKIILYYLIAIIVGVLLMRPLCGMMANTISNWSFGWLQKTVLLPILLGIIYLPFKMQEIPLLKKDKKIPIGPIGAFGSSLISTLEGKDSIKFEQSFTDKLLSNNSVQFGKYRERTDADDIKDALNPF